MTDRHDGLLRAMADLVLPLLDALEALRLVARHMHPPMLDRLLAAVGAPDAAVRTALPAFSAADWPDRLGPFRDDVEAAAAEACGAFDELRAAAAGGDAAFGAYRALRRVPRALEALYRVAPLSPPVCQFFLEPGARADEALIERLMAAEQAEEAGVFHVANERGSRGGYSVYLPPVLRADEAFPLVVALHGGRGNGRAFLWSWLREARSRGAVLVAPTAVGETWSLMEPELDAGNIARIVDEVGARRRLDPSRMLLTGMSDGGTFTWLAGLTGDSPFTHLAPFSASFHPMLLAFADERRTAGLPIRLVHGALDWMFPVRVAREAAEALAGRGAALLYREIADLSHAYAVDENPALLDWFLGTSRGAATPGVEGR